MTRNARGQFAPGNSGKPKGAKNGITRSVEKLLDGEAEALTRKCVEKAKTGDMAAMRLCMERIAPVRKGRPVPFPLPEIEGLADVPKAGAAILQAVATGKLSPEEAQSLMAVVEGFRRSVETAELEARIKALEETDA